MSKAINKYKNNYYEIEIFIWCLCVKKKCDKTKRQEKTKRETQRVRIRKSVPFDCFQRNVLFLIINFCFFLLVHKKTKVKEYSAYRLSMYPFRLAQNRILRIKICVWTASTRNISKFHCVHSSVDMFLRFNAISMFPFFLQIYFVWICSPLVTVSIWFR